jgi:hypothetical protein
MFERRKFLSVLLCGFGFLILSGMGSLGEEEGPRRIPVPDKP